jgi:putative transposon-encoded protein
MPTEVLKNRPIVKCGNSAHILIPKKFLGKRATVIIILEDEKSQKEGEDAHRK